MTVEALNSIHPFTFNSVRLAPNQTCNLELNNVSTKSIKFQAFLTAIQEGNNK